jgi:hypothetical protein
MRFSHITSGTSIDSEIISVDLLIGILVFKVLFSVFAT